MRRFSIANYLLPRVRDILFLIVFAVAMASGWRTLNTDGDLPRHLLLGRVIVGSHSVPRLEMFSYIYEGRLYVAHEWLADVVYYLCYQALGFKGVVLLTAILIATAFFVLYSTLSNEHQAWWLTLLLLLWGAAITFQHWVARPHLFTMLFLAGWLVLTDRISRGRLTSFWILPGLMVVWGNTHAEFVSGFLVLIAYIAGWTWDYLFRRPDVDPAVITKLVATLACSFVASLINPFGLQTWVTILSYLGNNRLLSTINETRPPDFSNPAFLLEFLLIGASILILSLKKGRIRSGHAFLLAGFTALALMSGRNIHLYGIVAPFVLIGPVIEVTDSEIARRFTSALADIEPQLRGFVWPMATVLFSLALLASGKIGKDDYIDPHLFPVDAVSWLESHPQTGNMFNDFKWGGYIVWRMWPAQKDFIDSQSDLTGEATAMYGTVETLSDGWQTVLAQYDVKWVIMPVDSALSRELISEGWTILYQDTTAIVLRQE